MVIAVEWISLCATDERGARHQDFEGIGAERSARRSEQIEDRRIRTGPEEQFLETPSSLFSCFVLARSSSSVGARTAAGQHGSGRRSRIASGLELSVEHEHRGRRNVLSRRPDEDRFEQLLLRASGQASSRKPGLHRRMPNISPFLAVVLRHRLPPHSGPIGFLSPTTLPLSNWR